MAKPGYSYFRRWILGQKHQNLPQKKDRSKEDTADGKSDRRRLFSRFTILSSILIICFSIYAHSTEYSNGWAYLLFWLGLIWAVWFYAFVVITIPFRASPSFAPNGQRLALDTLISGFNWITICGYYYALTGLRPLGEEKSLFDYYYFSTVTFSTLGYGDFNPTPEARLLASSEAIIGNLHLGVLVAAAFLVASSRDSHLTGNNSSSDADNHEG